MSKLMKKPLVGNCEPKKARAINAVVERGEWRAFMGKESFIRGRTYIDNYGKITEPKSGGREGALGSDEQTLWQRRDSSSGGCAPGTRSTVSNHGHQSAAYLAPK